MSTSDFLVLLSIMVTLITVTIANNKKIWLYKFSILGMLLGVALCLIINFFIFYYDFRSMGMPAILEYNKGLRADYWGYIISVISLFLLALYVAKSKYFPKSNWEKIVRYYKELLVENPSLLIGFIESYHLQHIEQIIEEYNSDVQRKASSKNESFFNELSGKTLSTKVWSEVFLTREIVCQIAKIHPLLFLRLFSQYHSNTIPEGKEFLQLYFKELIKNRNPIFIKELNEFFNHENDSILARAEKTNFFKEILQKDDLWIVKHEIVRAIGEDAKMEIVTEWSSFLQDKNEWNNAKYNQTICYQCLQLYSLQYMYLTEYMAKHPEIKIDVVNASEFIPYDNTIADICKVINRQESSIREAT